MLTFADGIKFNVQSIMIMKQVLLCDELAEFVNELRSETDNIFYKMQFAEIGGAMCDYVSGYEGTELSERDASRYKSTMECFYHYYRLIVQMARGCETK